MDIISRLIAMFALVVSLAGPTTASAAGLSFGGRIVGLTPCANGAIFVQIIPAGGDPSIWYIWTPATLTTLPVPPEPPLSKGVPAVPGIPPTHPGQEIKGIADIPYVCYIPPTILLFGERMQTAVESPI